MKAWAIVENGKPLQELTLPTPEPKGTEVLIEVTHTGICHSDLHIWDGYYDLGRGEKLFLNSRGGIGLPMAMGHEIFGRVLKLGPEVQHASIGDERIVYPWIGCGDCHRCKEGAANLCSIQNRSLGVFNHGGYASHICVEEANLVDPGDVEPALAATLPCSALSAYSAVRSVLPKNAKHPVVVIGCGGLGLAAIALLKKLGQQKIIAVDTSADSLALAEDVGASETVLSSGNDIAKKIAASSDIEIASAIDFVGRPETVKLALSFLAKGGALAVNGLFGGEVNLSTLLIPLRAHRIQGFYAGSLNELKELVALAQNNGLPKLPITCKHNSECNSILTNMKEGKVQGRTVITR